MAASVLLLPVLVAARKLGVCFRHVHQLRLEIVAWVPGAVLEVVITVFLLIARGIDEVTVLPRVEPHGCACLHQTGMCFVLRFLFSNSIIHLMARCASGGAEVCGTLHVLRTDIVLQTSALTRRQLCTVVLCRAPHRRLVGAVVWVAILTFLASAGLAMVAAAGVSALVGVPVHKAEVVVLWNLACTCGGQSIQAHAGDNTCVGCICHS